MTKEIVQPFDYTGRDYVALRDQLKAYFQGRVPEWVADPSDMGYILIEAMAYMGDLLSYYVDIAAQESTILSSNSPNNVVAHALLYGYQPSLAISAETDLVLRYTRPVGDFPQSAEVSAGREVFDPRTGLSFEIDEDAVIPDGATVTVKALEGRTVNTRIGTSSGAAGQRMTVPLESGSYVDGREGKSSIVVATKFSSTTWRATYNLLDHGPNDRVYALFSDSVGNTMVMFGDGTSGAIPPKGAEIVLTFRQCSGALGNNVGQGSLNQWFTSYDAPISYAAALTVTNPGAPVGGVNVEGLDSVRRQTVNFARAQRRAVSTDDYDRVARASGEVLTASSKAAVWSQPRVWILPRDPNVLNDEDRRERIKTTVDNALEQLSMIGTSPVVTYGNVADITMEVEAHVWGPVDVRVAAGMIRTALLEEFSYENCDFEREISEDYVLRVIRDRIDDDVVRFARVTKMTGKDSEVVGLGMYPGVAPPDPDFTPILGFEPRDGYAIVVPDSKLKIVVTAPGKRYEDPPSDEGTP